VTVREGLIVTVPRKFPSRRIEALVQSNESRIERAVQLVEEKKKDLLPVEIQLRALGQTWSVDYSDSDQETAIVESGCQMIALLV
jgi:predicted metal-dependent hydrolase